MIPNYEPVKKGSLWETVVHGYASSFAEKERMVAELMNLTNIENCSMMEKAVKKDKIEFKPKITSTQKMKQLKKQVEQSPLRPLTTRIKSLIPRCLQSLPTRQALMMVSPVLPCPRM